MAIQATGPRYKDSNWANTVTAGLDTLVFDGESILPVKQRQEPEGTMHMFDYPWPAIFSALVDNGFDEYLLSHTNHGGAHGPWIFPAATDRAAGHSLMLHGREY